MIALGKNSKKPLRGVYFYYGFEIVSAGQSHPERTVTIDQSMYGAPVLFVDILK